MFLPDMDISAMIYSTGAEKVPAVTVNLVSDSQGVRTMISAHDGETLQVSGGTVVLYIFKVIVILYLHNFIAFTENNTVK